MTTTTTDGPAFTVEHNARNVTTVSIDCGCDLDQWFLLRSDAHHDNPHCDQSLEKRHLEQALERNAGIIDAGDIHCAMQGKYDKRSNKSSLREEHQNGRYLDSLVETAADFYAPYAHHWIVMGRGNHEQKILERHETDLTQRLCAVLNARTGSTIQAGGYTGWVRFRFNRSTERLSRTLWYTHGYGGGGPVTEDTIQQKRQMVYIENADIMLSGHAHRQWVHAFIRHKLNQSGRIEKRKGWALKTPTYKDSYGDGYDGFEVERGMGPRPLGAWWLRFWWDGRRGLQLDVTNAD